MSKKNFSIILIIVLQLLAAGEKYIGINFLFGGRYDNLRMCVGSPAGVKGGPIADIGLDIKVSLDNQHDLVINLPIMRPILFGAAFKMLQYEPSVSLIFKKKQDSKINFISGLTAGLSLHYGPDYKAAKGDSSPSFFAAGPYLSALFGFNYFNSNNKERLAGVRLFYTPLFAKNRTAGTVLGAALEAHFDFNE